VDPEKDELTEGALITPDDLSPVQESQSKLIVPKKGSIFKKKVVEGHEAYVGKFAIIRPCRSKGRAIRGLQPIYEAKMLAEHASVFTGWPMYIDHMAEELAEEVMELLQEKGRSYFDPDLVFEDDADHGYQKGGVVGEVIPQKTIREMLEEDAGCLNVSINAWPKAVRVGAASWDKGVKGALIEGIREKPMGSVDFVFRGGAGGRPLSEEERRSAVSLLESAYTAPRDGDDDRKERQVKLSEMSQEQIAALTPEELAEALKEAGNPSLAESIISGGKADPAPNATGAITEAQLDAALTKQRAAITEEFQGAQLSETEIKERAEAIVEEREEYRILADHAVSEIETLQENGLPKEYGAEIRKNYVLYASGPSRGLMVEGEDIEAKKEAITESVKADCIQANKLIEAAGGTPRVTGLGASEGDPNGDGGKTRESETPSGLRQGSRFTQFLEESGDLTGDKDKDEKHLHEMLSEGR
jgi:hypothetical protein